MDFLVQSAHAAGGGGAQGNSAFFSLLFPILILALFYFLFIRPQQKRVKEHRQMVDDLSTGDEVVTAGGLAGRINEVHESFVTMTIADGVDVKVQKQSVQSLLPKGTL